MKREFESGPQPTFTGTISFPPECPKCWGSPEKLRYAYCPSKTELDVSTVCTIYECPESLQGGEHLHCSCGECSYKFSRPCRSPIVLRTTGTIVTFKPGELGCHFCGSKLEDVKEMQETKKGWICVDCVKKLCDSFKLHRKPEDDLDSVREIVTLTKQLLLERTRVQRLAAKLTEAEQAKR